MGLIETGPLVGWKLSRTEGKQEATIRGAWLFVLQCLASGDREKAWLALKWQPDKSKPETLADYMARGARELLEELRAEFSSATRATEEAPPALPALPEEASSATRATEKKHQRDQHTGGLAAAARSAARTAMGPIGHKAKPSKPKPAPELTPHQVWIRDNPGSPWPGILDAPLVVTCRICAMKGLEKPVKACKACRGEGDSHQDEFARAAEQQADLDRKRGGWPFPCTVERGRAFCELAQEHESKAFQPRHDPEKGNPACEFCTKPVISKRQDPEAPRAVRRKSGSTKIGHQDCFAQALDWFGRDAQLAKVEEHTERYAIQKEAKEVEGTTAQRPEGRTYGTGEEFMTLDQLDAVNALLEGEPVGDDSW